MVRNLRITGVIILGLAASAVPAAAWKPVAGHIMTPWAAEVNPHKPLPDYPRPQLVRQDWVNLNGLWNYAIQATDGAAPERYDGKILVPFPVESALSGVKRMLAPTNRLWYQRTFHTPDLKGQKRLLLHFGAVDWETKVWVNGQIVGEHRGGYDPFSFDITAAVKPGAANELIVKVYDPGTALYQPDGKQNYKKFIKPGGIAYTASSGIWQTAWLETVPAQYIRDLKITPDVDAGVLRVRVAAAGAAANSVVKVVALAGKKVVGHVTGPAGEELQVPVPQARLWTPDNPFLYTLKVELGADAVSSYAGMRKISIGKDEKGLTRILLNGKFVFHSGPLDQGFWPDGLYTAPTDEALRFDIAEMKRLGFNMVRKHLKVEPARWYYWCDQLGLLVWQDMPCADGGTGGNKEVDGVVKSPEAAQIFEAELKAMIEAYYNHPSIVLWTIFNENWGQYDTPRITKWVKELDPSRVVSSTSGWFDHNVGDVLDVHNYPTPICPPAEVARVVVLGEFGGLGLTIPKHTWIEKNAWGYTGMSGERALTRKYVEYWREVWRLKETGLSAAVYTQLTDVETECNGLFTYDRKHLKVDAKQVAAAHRGEFAPLPTFLDVVPTAQTQPVAWRYTTVKPGNDWFSAKFDAARWSVGAAGFGSSDFTNAPVRTTWDGEDLWLRREIVLPRGKLSHPALKMLHGQDAEVFINGVLALKVSGRSAGYEEFDIKPQALQTLKPGVNQIAVHCHKETPGSFIDVGFVQEQEK
jgi:hypothetical protein